jgi:two-component system sensor kinase FixL
MSLPSAEDRLDAARWQSIVATARDGIVTIDRQGAVTSFNAAAERIFGYCAAEVLGHNVNMLMASPYREDHDGYLERYQSTGERRAIGRIRYVHARRSDGSVRPIELSVSEGQVGSQVFYTAIVRDVRDTDHRYRLVVDLAASVILVLSPDLKIFEFNREAERVFGRSREEVLGRRLPDLVAPEDQAALESTLLRVLAGEELRAMEGQVPDPAGERRTLSWNASRMVQPGGDLAGIIAVGQDITDRKDAEARLREEQTKLIQAEKLSSIGQLAAGVAHEVNNPLAGVKSLVAALRSGRLAPDRQATYYDAITDGLGRIEQTVRALLDYARPSSGGAATTLDLHDIVTACLRLCRPAQHKKELQVDLLFEPGEHRVVGDRHGLMQATLNVLLNATYAAPEGSSLVVAAERDESTISLHFDDEGPGFPAEHLHRVCDPFFTTKPEGEGTGLGLAVTQNIIAQHHGRLVLQNRPEGGARVTFVLPAEE